MDFRVSVLLSMQRALWELVTPGLRGVSVRAEFPDITARFLYADEPSDDDREDVSLAETYVVADFQPEVKVSFVPIWLPVEVPVNMPPEEEWVYLRKEA